MSALTEPEIKRAIKCTALITGPDYSLLSRTEKQIVHSLQVYQNRGEFDGSYESAWDCLGDAGYEVPSKGPVSVS